MATKQPKIVNSPKVGQADVKKTLSEPISDATLRSGEYKPTKPSGS